MILTLLLLLVFTASGLTPAVEGTMEAATIITEHPSNKTAPLNSNVTFTCRGYRYIYWEVANLPITSQLARKAANQAKIFANIDEQNSSQLFMLASVRNNGKRIRCNVRVDVNNILSSEPSNFAYLSVYDNPDPPTNLTITSSGLNVSLSWEVPFSLAGENISYIVEVTNTHSRESRQLESDSSQLVFREPGDRDCSLYEFRVYSVNPFGRSNTSISGNIRIPTEPLILHSTDISVSVSLENGLSVTLSFNAPTPCSAYQVSSYSVTFTEFAHGVNSSIINSMIMNSCNCSESVLLRVDQNLDSNKAYLVTIEARNMAGSRISQPVEVYTTGLQSSSVMLEVNDTASVTCTFAVGSDALGCQVSFYDSTTMELLFSRNIIREPASNTVTKNTPFMGKLEGRNASSITVLTAEWLANGSVSSIHIQPQTTTRDEPIEIITDTTTDMLYGSILGGVVVAFLLCVAVAVFGISLFVIMRKRKVKGSHNRTKDHSIGYGDDSQGVNPKIADQDSKPEKRCDDSYVLMQSNAESGQKKQFVASNPMYAGREMECQKPTYSYEELVLSRVKSAPGTIYDQVKFDPDGVKLQGNESYGIVAS